MCLSDPDCCTVLVCMLRVVVSVCLLVCLWEFIAVDIGSGALLVCRLHGYIQLVWRLPGCIQIVGFYSHEGVYQYISIYIYIYIYIYLYIPVYMYIYRDGYYFETIQKLFNIAYVYVVKNCP